MNPHVSDEQINDIAIRNAGFDETNAVSIRLGMFKSRDLYEPLVTSQKERIAALEEALRDAVKEMERCKKFCHQAYTICDHNSILALRDVPNNLAITSARALLTPKTTDPK